MAEGYKRQNVGAPILHALVELGGSADRQKIKEQIVDDSTNNLTYEDVFEPITSKNGNQYIPFNFDFNFGIQELLSLGYIESYSRKGDIVLTEKGRLVNIDLYPNKKEQEQIKKFWATKHSNNEPSKTKDTVDKSNSLETTGEKNDVEDVLDQWKIDVLDKIKQFSPKKFESFSRLLFSKMGVKFDPVKGVKMSGDHGMDGYGTFVSDEFRTSKVVMQCKRFTNSPVSGPDIDKFKGVMDSENADYGIFVTTSYFTPDAKTKALQGSRTVTLINGQDLVKLIERYELHIKPVTTYELDNYYSEQD